MTKRKRVEVCAVPDCGRVASSRGMCASCYSAAHLMVVNRETTWKYLEDHGLAKPPKKRENSLRLAVIKIKLQK